MTRYSTVWFYDAFLLMYCYLNSISKYAGRLSCGTETRVFGKKIVDRYHSVPYLNTEGMTAQEGSRIM